MTDTQDQRWMDEALRLADDGALLGEVPVGAVVVLNGDIIGRGFNRVITDADPTSHAEIVAMRDACRRLGNYRLPGSMLYVTLEPCTMCAGAMVHARVSELIFATAEPRAGAVRSTASVLDSDHLNHRVVWREGVRQQESARRLVSFFRGRRGPQQRSDS